jgi:hypothetical protein
MKRLIAFFFPYAQNKSATVRYAFPIIFTLIALFGAAAVSTSGKSYIHLESSASSVHAGENFKIAVYVNATVPVNAIDIAVQFPKEQIQITGIDTGASVITLWTQDPYVEDNKVILRGGTFRKGFRGDHLIATINAKATETGLAQFTVGTVTLLAGDGSGSSVSVAKDPTAKTFYVVEGTGEQTKASAEESAVGLQGSAAVVIVTDIDGDGAVTLADVGRFMAAWGGGGIVYDFNGDGIMTFRDFGIILADSFFR